MKHLRLTASVIVLSTAAYAIAQSANHVPNAERIHKPRLFGLFNEKAGRFQSGDNTVLIESNEAISVRVAIPPSLSTKNVYAVLSTKDGQRPVWQSLQSKKTGAKVPANELKTITEAIGFLSNSVMFQPSSGAPQPSRDYAVIALDTFIRDSDDMDDAIRKLESGKGNLAGTKTVIENASNDQLLQLDGLRGDFVHAQLSEASTSNVLKEIRRLRSMVMDREDALKERAEKFQLPVAQTATPSQKAARSFPTPPGFTPAQKPSPALPAVVISGPRSLEPGSFDTLDPDSKYYEVSFTPNQIGGDESKNGGWSENENYIVRFVATDDDEVPTTLPTDAPGFTMHVLRGSGTLSFDVGTMLVARFDGRNNKTRSVAATDALGNPLTLGGKPLYEIQSDDEHLAWFQNPSFSLGATYLLPERLTYHMYPERWGFGRAGVFVAGSVSADSTDPNVMAAIIQNINRSETLGVFLGLQWLHEDQIVGQKVGAYYVNVQKEKLWSKPLWVAGLRYKFQ